MNRDMGAVASEPRSSGFVDPGTDWAPAMEHSTGLDGLRAVALLSVFLLHADLSTGSGGFLGVSTFFTLSGFLITSLLLSEHSKHGRIDLRRFWTRRARRLLPAALIVIAGIVLATTAFGDASQLQAVRGDALAALCYVANWRFVVTGAQYGAAYSASSPLLHFWSLAIEEQFYLCFPLILVGALALRRRRPWAVAAVLGGLLALSVVDGVILSLHGSVDRLYFGTDVRAAELLVGALAAWFWTTRRAQFDRHVARWLSPAGVVALVVMTWLFLTARSTDLVWYRGGLFGFALLSCTVLLSAIQPGTVVQRVLSWRPLAWVGVTSYAAYLLHWPIFMWIAQHTDTGGGERLVLGTALSIALASLSYILVERPIRSYPVLPRWTVTIAPAALILVALTATSIIPESASVANDVPLSQRKSDFTAALRQQRVKPDAPKVAMFGDSTALSTALGMATWGKTGKSDIKAVLGWVDLGCSILSPATIQVHGVVHRSSHVCDKYLIGWELAAAAHPPDIAVIQTGPFELSDIELPGTSDFLALGAPTVDAALEVRMTEAARALLKYAPVVVILTTPHIQPGMIDGQPPSALSDQAAPNRVSVYNHIVREVAATDPRIKVLDYGSYIDGLADLATLRPDGVHLTRSASAEMVANWLGPHLVALAPHTHP